MIDRPRRTTRPPWLRVFGAPLVIGVLTLAGLVSALLLGDVGRVFAWVALSVPLAAVAWAVWSR